jgi:hypothetical protein
MRAAAPSGCKTEAAKAKKHHHPRRRLRDAGDGAEQTCMLIVDAVGEVEAAKI